MQLALWTFLCKSAMGTEGYLVPLAPLSTFTLKPVVLPSYSVNPPHHPPTHISRCPRERQYHSGWEPLLWLHSTNPSFWKISRVPCIKPHPSCHFFCEYFWSRLWIESTPSLCPNGTFCWQLLGQIPHCTCLGLRACLCPARPYPASLIRLWTVWGRG